MIECGRKTLEGHKIDYLFISTHGQALHDKIVEDLTELKYSVEISSNLDTETTSLDGFIFASSPKVEKLFLHFPLIGREKIAQSTSEELLHALQLIQEQRR